MRLIKTGKYEAPIELEWNECLFVDRVIIIYIVNVAIPLLILDLISILSVDREANQCFLLILLS
jgi:hypothetical protein